MVKYLMFFFSGSPCTKNMLCHYLSFICSVNHSESDYSLIYAAARCCCVFSLVDILQIYFSFQDSISFSLFTLSKLILVCVHLSALAVI